MTTAVRLTLHDLGEAQNILDRFLFETEGEETPEIAELWEQLSGQVEDKVERYALWIRGQQGQAELIKAEEERLFARRKAFENAAKRGKDNLQFHMERLGRDKVKGKLVTVAIQVNAPSVRPLTDDFSGKPARFTRTVPARFEWDKKAMLDAWKEDPSCLDGIAAVEQTTSLRIR